MQRTAFGFAAAITLATLSFTSFGRAEGSAQSAAAAQALYDEGKRLLTAGKAVEACPKLEESQRLDPAVGTKFLLADCYEKTGRTASAWALFHEVAAASKLAGHADRTRVAGERVAALEGRLARLTITVREPVEGMELKQDGVVLGKAQWGTAMPVDPGAHAITVAAPGHKPFRTTVSVIGDRADASVTIPALEVEPIVPQPPPPKPTKLVVPIEGEGPRDDGATRRTLGLILGGVGLVGMGVGGYFGLRAIAKNDDSAAGCNVNACTAEAAAMRNDARDAGNVATLAFVGGGVALAAGAVLFFTAPSRSAPPQTGRLRPGAFAAPGQAYLTVGGVW